MMVSGWYAAWLALLALWLAWRVVLRRRDTGIGIGDGGDIELTRRQRAQGNFLEQVPMALLLLLLLDLGSCPAWALHGFGITLLAGRLLHAWGISHSEGTSFGRLAGTLLTWLTVLGMAGLLLGQQVVDWLG